MKYRHTAILLVPVAVWAITLWHLEGKLHPDPAPIDEWCGWTCESTKEEQATVAIDPSTLVPVRTADLDIDTVFDGGSPTLVMRFSQDGTVWVNPKLKPDEAARQVIELIKQMWIRQKCVAPDAKETSS